MNEKYLGNASKNTPHNVDSLFNRLWLLCTFIIIVPFDPKYRSSTRSGSFVRRVRVAVIRTKKMPKNIHGHCPRQNTEHNTRKEQFRLRHAWQIGRTQKVMRAEHAVPTLLFTSFLIMHFHYARPSPLIRFIYKLFIHTSRGHIDDAPGTVLNIPLHLH